MSGNVADIGGAADPRLGGEADAIGSYKYDNNTGMPIDTVYNRPLFDSSVTFEEYNYWAKQEREYEKHLEPAGLANAPAGLKKVMFLGAKKRSVKETTDTVDVPARASLDEKHPELRNADDASSGEKPNTGGFFISDEDKHTMGRAARTATWGAVFYLITTDILGPFSTPWAMSQLGYGPSVGLYTAFAIMAGYSGFQLWYQFLGLDSAKYPVKTYSDLAFRLFGNVARYISATLQEFQFFMGVVLLIITTGQSLSQMSQGPHGRTALCFVGCLAIMTAIGIFLSQIRTLQRLGWFANASVWINLLTIFITMGVVAHSAPNWVAVKATYNIDEGPLYHSANFPPGTKLTDRINGLMQAVYSFGGATLFCELMAEMRRPWDFWKGLICADLLIYVAYMLFGLFVYAYQGQATYNPAYQGVDPYAWQTVCNAFQLFTSLVAAALYGNIGIKVLYNNVGRAYFGCPELETRTGKIIWIFFAPTYWVLCFILAAAVPQVSYLGAFVASASIMQFSYTFPPLFAIAYNVMNDTSGTYDPSTGAVTRPESRVFKRFMTGYFKRPVWNIFNTIYFLGALTTAILGLYASGVGMRESFATSSGIKSFSCDSPTG